MINSLSNTNEEISSEFVDGSLYIFYRLIMNQSHIIERDELKIFFNDTRTDERWTNRNT